MVLIGKSDKKQFFTPLHLRTERVPVPAFKDFYETEVATGDNLSSPGQAKTKVLQPLGQLLVLPYMRWVLWGDESGTPRGWESVVKSIKEIQRYVVEGESQKMLDPDGKAIPFERCNTITRLLPLLSSSQYSSKVRSFLDL